MRKAAMSNTITVRLPKLHPLQKQVAFAEERYQVVCLGRRTGKTVLACYLMANGALRGESWGYFAPAYNVLTETWEYLKQMLQPVTRKKDESNHTIHLITGGHIRMWGLYNDLTVRGRKYHGVVIDEAAHVTDLLKSWQYVITPTLTDYKGRAYFFSTPNGHNGFWQLYNQGIDPLYNDWRAWNYPTTANPYIDASEVEAQRKQLPDRAFRQEYLAEFIADAGGVFRNVHEACHLEPVQQPEAGHDYIFGVDWGRSNDFTVISVLDATTKQQVAVDRFNMIGWELQRERIKTMYERWKPSTIVAEENSIGDVNIEALMRDGLPIRRFTTTANTKTPLIDALSVAIEKGEIGLLSDRVQMAELQAFEITRLPSGSFRYASPDGGHDDMVMALALAWYGVRTNYSTLKVLQW
jgi:phage FluMu gp28-like protein